VCGEQKVKRLRFRFGLGDLVPDWFLTLTLQTYDEKPLMASWNLFLAGLKKDGYKVRYLLAKEHTRAGKAHLHVIGEGWMPYTQLSRRWKRATNNASRITHVRRLRDKKRAAGYVTKYMSKSVGSHLFRPKERRYSASRGVLLTLPNEKGGWETYIYKARHGPKDYAKYLARTNRLRRAHLATLLPRTSTLLSEQEHLSTWTLIHSISLLQSCAQDVPCMESTRSTPSESVIST